MKTLRRLTLAALFSILMASLADAQVIPQAVNPEEVGLSKERLQKISAWIQNDVDKKVIPGAVVMVLRKGKVAYYEAFGYQDREKNIPMVRLSIFRMYWFSGKWSIAAIAKLVPSALLSPFDGCF
jgi:CubicO group peptidase (beta-lactamase class C family)